MAKQILCLCPLLVAAWCVMTLTHEMGHLVGGWYGGGTLIAAELRPWHLPYTIFDPDPRPLVTLWCGPILGAVAPLLVALLVRREWMWFVASFCVVANGAFIATAPLVNDRFLDTPRLLNNSAHPAAIAIYCIVTVGPGYVGLRRSCVNLLRGSRVGLESSLGRD